MTATRAYSLLHVKSLDPDRRILTGVATSPTPDRAGDVIEMAGVTFTNPLPLLLYHDPKLPVGTVTLDPPTAKGVTFTAQIADITEPGHLKDRVDEAWASLRNKLIRGVSIGFRVLNDAMDFMQDTGGVRFRAIEILELSLVAVPANIDATVTSLKQFDTAPAATGTGARVVRLTSPGAPGPRHTSTSMKTIQDQISGFEATRQAKNARMTELMTAAGEKGETLDKAQEDEYDGLEADVKSIDAHLVRLRALEEHNKKAAVPVNGTDPAAAAAARGGAARPVIQVKHDLPPGIQLARAVICKMNAYLTHRPAYEIAKERYPDDSRVQLYLKATVAAGTTTDSDWASALVDQTNLASEFIEFLRPMTIVGKFGTGNIPSLRRVPFNVRMVGQTTGGTANWVGQAKPKPLTKFHFAATTLSWAKIAAISVISDELARFSVPSAEDLVRDALSETIVEKIDTDFIDPAVAAVANVSPASITNGLTALTSAGTSADNIRTDIQNLVEQFILNNHRVTGLVLIMPETLALAASIMVNSLGQREFPDLNVNGGTILGIPVITSQYAANESSFGNMIIAVNAREIFLADDGQVTIDVSREAALEMLDSGFTQNQPTGASLVSLWQNNLLGIKAERYINWAKRRAEAVVYMDDVNWGAIGSPV